AGRLRSGGARTRLRRMTRAVRPDRQAGLTSVRIQRSTTSLRKLRSEAFVNARIADEKIKLNDDKTERRPFDGTDQRAAQYLGLKLSGTRTRLRESSLSR